MEILSLCSLDEGPEPRERYFQITLRLVNDGQSNSYASGVSIVRAMSLLSGTNSRILKLELISDRDSSESREPRDSMPVSGFG